LLLGSVSQALLRHADCPVAVVRWSEHWAGPRRPRPTRARRAAATVPQRPAGSRWPSALTNRAVAEEPGR